MNEKKEQTTGSPFMKFVENKQLVALTAAVVAILAVILVSALALKIAVVPVCLILILIVGIAACLNDEPIWLHGIVVVALIIAGILCENLIFMILGAVIYLVAIFALKYMKEA